MITWQFNSSKQSIEQIIAQTASNKTAQRNTGDLGKDQFLKLLLTQLKYQDPMNPVEDKEFIGQMAQFSSLEQMQSMNSGFSTIRATNYLGKQVKASFVDPVTHATKNVSWNCN